MSVIVLWHWRGPNEAHVLRPLAATLQRKGHTVLTPDWIPGAADRGAGALTASLEQAVALTGGRPGVPLVVVGWSLGGRAAVSLALDPVPVVPVTGVVGLAAGLRGPSPLDGTVPLERVLDGCSRQPPPIQLVHGRQDTVVPPDVSVQFPDACRTVGIRCRLSLVDSDHAGVVGTRYDPHLRLCVPDDGPAATTGLEAALSAVRVARQAGRTIQ